MDRAVLVIIAVGVCCCHGKSIQSSCPLEVQVQVEGGESDQQQLIYIERGDDGDIKKEFIGSKNGTFSIEFHGPEGLQWTYDGPGLTELIPTSERNEKGCEVIRLNKPDGVALDVANTGRYAAYEATRPGQAVDVYLYVANKYPPYLMNAGRLHNVMHIEGKPLVLPCLLNDPTMKVGFSKRVGLNEWREVGVSDGAFSYSPKIGFLLKKPFRGMKSLFGSYKCFTSLHNRNDTVFINVSPNDY